MPIPGCIQEMFTNMQSNMTVQFSATEWHCNSTKETRIYSTILALLLRKLKTSIMFYRAIKKHSKSTLSVQRRYATSGIISQSDKTMGRRLSTTRWHSRATLNIQMPGRILEKHSLAQITMIRLFSASKEPSKLILRNLVS